ncbi:MAG: flagellar filament capping protein FliD [Sulfuricurvum sp.]|nr:flagellar filament capping protein FliD [Sulfuricurvum sp.]
MAGTVNSLGLGSGVLTADMIDKLRTNNEAQVIKPLDNRIASSQLKLKSFDLLNTLMSTFQTSVSKLSSDTLFLGRSVSGNSDAVSVSAAAGSDVQSFALSDIVTAKGDIFHSASIASKTTPLAPSAVGTGTLSLSIGTDAPIAINYTAATTLQELATAINDQAGTKVTASILQTGATTYELMIKADGVGANQNITLADSIPDATGLTAALGMTKIQTAGDATFKYNGIATTRPTNDITDLLNGVTVSLKQDQIPLTQVATIAITQNKTEISTEMALFVQTYNTLVTNIGDMTAYDKTAGKVGVFNGDNYIKSITRELNRTITSVDSTGKSLVDYGISLDRSGIMSLDSAVFDAKMTQDPVSLQNFLSGGTVVNGVTTTGVFDTLFDQMKNYTGHQKSLTNFQGNLTKTFDKLTKEHETMTKRLDDRYAIMTKQFGAYDAIISKINNQFSSLKQMIDAQSSSNN